MTTFGVVTQAILHTSYYTQIRTTARSIFFLDISCFAGCSDFRPNISEFQTQTHLLFIFDIAIGQNIIVNKQICTTYDQDLREIT